MSAIKRTIRKNRASASAGERALVDPVTKLLRPVPSKRLGSKEQVCAVLTEIQSQAGYGKSRGSALTPCSLLGDAVVLGCITLDDAQTILGTPIQFLLIYDLTLGETVNSDIGEEGDRSNEAQYLDFLLFLAELHNPSVNRLRKARRKYDMESLSQKGAYSKSPEPTVATIGWEKRLREDTQFGGWADEVLSNLVTHGIGYWAISMGGRCSDGRKWFLALDAKGQVDAECSRRYMNFINDPDPGEQPDGETIRPAALDFCMSNNLEFAGTPIYPISQAGAARENAIAIPDEITNDAIRRPIHFLAQQVSVAFRNNAYQVQIPAFYRSTHVKRLLKTDFFDLQHALDRKMGFGARYAVSIASRDECPLPESVMRDAAKCIFTVLRLPTLGYAKAQAYHFTALAMKKWWAFMDEYNGMMVRAIRPPSGAFPHSKLLKAIPADDIIALVVRHIDDSEMNPAQRYAFDRYRGERDGLTSE